MCSAKGQNTPQGRKLEFGNFWGGCSAKGQIWTQGRKLEFGIRGGVLPKVRFGLREENWSLEILEGWGVFCQRSDLDSGKKIGVWNLGGCSAKGQIWTQGRKLEFGNFGGGGGCSVKGQIWTQGRKVEFGNLGGGCSAKGQIQTW